MTDSENVRDAHFPHVAQPGIDDIGMTKIILLFREIPHSTLQRPGCGRGKTCARQAQLSHSRGHPQQLPRHLCLFLNVRMFSPGSGERTHGELAHHAACWKQMPVRDELCVTSKLHCKQAQRQSPRWPVCSGGTQCGTGRLVVRSRPMLTQGRKDTEQRVAAVVPLAIWP